MERNILITLLISALFFCSSSSIAAQGVIYQWVDQNNIVHFSEQQPEHDNYTTLQVLGVPQTKQQNSDKKSTVQQTAKEKAQPTSPELQKQLNTRCEEAKENLKTLQTYTNVRVQNTDGEFSVLSEEEKQQQIIISQKQIEVYCSTS